MQWESNPHSLHGKQTGCRYIMHAECLQNDECRNQNDEAMFFILASSFVIPFSGTGGYRTHIIRFKRPVHYLVCHNPNSVVPDGVVPGTIESGEPKADGHNRHPTRSTPLSRFPFPLSVQSGRLDLNQRSRASEARGMARLSYVLNKHPVGESNPFPTGIRSPSAVSAGRGVSCAYAQRGVEGRRVNPHLPSFSQPGPPLRVGAPSLLPNRLAVWALKKPEVAATPGFW